MTSCRVNKLDPREKIPEFIEKPRFISDKEQVLAEKQKELDTLARNTQPWQQYHKLEPAHSPMSKRFTRKSPFKTEFLEKGEYTSKYLELARTINDTILLGKK